MIENGHSRRDSTDYRELDQLLQEAGARLGREEMREAHASLKQASVKAASMWGVVGGAELPAPARDLISLTGAVQRSFVDPQRDGAQAMRADLRNLRDRFATEKD